MRITVTTLRKDLSAVLEQVKSGDAVDIEQRGKVVARLVPPAHDVPKTIQVAQQFKNAARIKQIWADEVRNAIRQNEIKEANRKDKARRDLLSGINKKPRSYG